MTQLGMRPSYLISWTLVVFHIQSMCGSPSFISYSYWHNKKLVNYWLRPCLFYSANMPSYASWQFLSLAGSAMEPTLEQSTLAKMCGVFPRACHPVKNQTWVVTVQGVCPSGLSRETCLQLKVVLATLGGTRQCVYLLWMLFCFTSSEWEWMFCLHLMLRYQVWWSTGRRATLLPVVKCARGGNSLHLPKSSYCECGEGMLC